MKDLTPDEIYYEPEKSPESQFETVAEILELGRSDALIGADAIILPIVTVGKGAIVAAGAVVNHKIEPHSIVGAIPMRKIGDIKIN